MKRPKFNPMEMVRVRTPDRHEKLNSQPPGRLIMGQTGTVEIAGLISGPASVNGDSMTPAYYIRVGDLPPILVYEEWLEDA